MELDVTKIVNEKVEALLESGELEKAITAGVEKNIKSAINEAINDYRWTHTIKENLSKVLGEAASNVNFAAYANFLRDRMNDQIEKYVKDDMINLMRDSFEKMYFNMPEDIKLSDILQKYKEYLENNLDSDDKKDWGHIDFSFEEEYSSFIRIEAGKPNGGGRGRFEKGLSMSLYKDSSSENKATISWIELDGNDFHTCTDLRRLTEFEILMFNLMFTRKQIEVDINEDFSFDYDFCEDDDY